MKKSGSIRRGYKGGVSVRKRRIVGRPFPPGVSGNPGGRPKGFVSAIRDSTENGIEIITFMLAVFRGQFRRATLRDRIAACSWLADRGFGRLPLALAVAPQPEMDEGANMDALDAAFDMLTDEEFQEVQTVLGKVLAIGEARTSSTVMGHRLD